MHARLVADKKGTIIFTDVLPGFLQSSLIKGTSGKAASGAFGYILLQQIQTPQFNIDYNCYCFTEADRLRVDSDIHMLALYFNLGDALNYHVEGLGNLSFKKGAFNFIYTPVLRNVLFINENEMYKTFSIQFSPDYLVSVAAVFPVMNAWVQKVHAREPALLHHTNAVAGADVINIIHEILNNQYSGEQLQLYLNARITDLLFLCFENNNQVQPSPAIHLWESDLAGIEAVRQELFINLNRQYSLSHLALKAGMNKNKLAKGFRQVVGLPLFNYQLQVRMTRAKSLLLATDTSVTAIGYEVGYRDVQAFSKAFKKYYGLSPSDYKKKYGHSYN
jgi:AraC-like DNA-binding protein